MPEITPQFLLVLEMVIFASAIFMHLAKKSSSIIFLYAAQSVAIVLLLLTPAVKEFSASLIAIAALVFMVKVIVAPKFFLGLIKKHQTKFSVSSYLSAPLTLIVLTVLTAVTHAGFLKSLADFAGANGSALLLSLSTILISLFLIINRRGALAQMTGILSLENAIVSFAALIGLEQSLGLEIGIAFDMLAWITIASIFASMVYKQFGSLDVTSMKNLTE